VRSERRSEKEREGEKRREKEREGEKERGREEQIRGGKKSPKIIITTVHRRLSPQSTSTSPRSP
jgi:hypothetical protein